MDLGMSQMDASILGSLLGSVLQGVIRKQFVWGSLVLTAAWGKPIHCKGENQASVLFVSQRCGWLHLASSWITLETNAEKRESQPHSQSRQGSGLSEKRIRRTSSPDSHTLLGVSCGQLGLSTHSQWRSLQALDPGCSPPAASAGAT